MNGHLQNSGKEVMGNIFATIIGRTTLELVRYGAVSAQVGIEDSALCGPDRLMTFRDEFPPSE